MMGRKEGRISGGDDGSNLRSWTVLIICLDIAVDYGKS